MYRMCVGLGAVTISLVSSLRQTRASEGKIKRGRGGEASTCRSKRSELDACIGILF